MLGQNSPLASFHLKLLKTDQTDPSSESERVRTKFKEVIAQEQALIHVFKKLGPTQVPVLMQFTSVQLLIRKEAILDFEDGETSNGTHLCHELIITAYKRHFLLDLEANSCNNHPNEGNFNCRIGAIVGLNTKKKKKKIVWFFKQKWSNICWFQLPNVRIFCFSLSFMKPNEASFGFGLFWCTKDAIWRACWSNWTEKS